jgi:hypothetical protein
VVPPRPGLCSVYAADVGSAAFSVNWACQWSCSSSVYDLPPRGRMPLRPGSALDFRRLIRFEYASLDRWSGASRWRVGSAAYM